jgi:hypothetical protein
MREIWLRPNRRAIWFGCVPPLVIGVMGAWIMFGISAGASSALRWIGLLLMAAGFAVVAALLQQLRRPRIAYQNDHVLFYLQAGQPFEVPVQIVEAFFIGQGPARLPGVPSQPRAANLVVRLSQRAAEWADREVKPALGKWCGGYVTICGAWCEPLHDELLRRLNRRLHEVKSESGPAPP